MPRQKGILPLPLIIYTSFLSFFFFPLLSPRETVTHNFLIRYRVSWKKRKAEKSVNKAEISWSTQRLCRYSIPLRISHARARYETDSLVFRVVWLPSPYLRSNENSPSWIFPKIDPSLPLYPSTPPFDFANPAKISKNFVSDALRSFRKYSTGSVRSNVSLVRVCGRQDSISGRGEVVN